MAVTITTVEIAAALRLGDGITAPAEPHASMLTRLVGVGTAFAETQAPDAPVAVQNESVVRVVAYLYDSPTAAGGERYSNAWRNSGAAALLAPWTPRRAGIDAEGVS